MSDGGPGDAAVIDAGVVDAGVVVPSPTGDPVADSEDGPGGSSDVDGQAEAAIQAATATTASRRRTGLAMAATLPARLATRIRGRIDSLGRWGD